MNHIPQRGILLSSSLTGRLDSEPLHDLIPQRLELLDHVRLTQWNPDVVHYEVSETKVLEAQVSGGLNRVCMVLQPVRKRSRVLRIFDDSSLARALWNGLAYVDRATELAVLVLVRDWLYGLQDPVLVNDVDTSAFEISGWHRDHGVTSDR